MVVLMALSTSVENPNFGKRNKGCHGCSGGYSSCCGGYYSGYSSGCCGGGYYRGGCGGGMTSAWYGGAGGGYYASEYGGGYPAVMPYESAYYPPGSTLGAEEGTRTTGTPGAAAATVRIRMPAGSGRLTIDDYTVPSGGDNHIYVTLPISSNDTRKISFRTEIMKDGKRETVTKQVTVKPGQRADVDFTAPSGGAPTPGPGR